MTDPALDLVTDHDVLAAYADLAGWDAVRAAGAVPPVSVAAVDQALAALSAEQSAEGRDAEPTQRRRGRRALVAVGLVAAVTAAALVLPSVLRAPSASAEAASLLTHAADSIHATDPVAGPTQWWRIESHETYLSAVTESDKDGSTSPLPAAAAWLVDSSRVQYAAVDGSRPMVFVDSSRVLRQVSGPPGAEAPRYGTPQTWTTGLAPTTVPGSWQQPSPTWLASLPRDPAALRDQLYADTAGHGRSVDGEAFVYVADLLRSGVVPADLRGSLYRVLATIPGVAITSSHATVGDATGVGLGYVEATDGTRQEIVVDPSNGDLVGERYVAVEALDGIPAGTVTGTTAWTRTLVDDVPTSVRAAVVDQNCTASADGGVSCEPGGK